MRSLSHDAREAHPARRDRDHNVADQRLPTSSHHGGWSRFNFQLMVARLQSLGGERLERYPSRTKISVVALGPNMRRFSLLCLIAGLIVEAGCGKEPTRPAVTDVRISVTAEPDMGSASAPITLRSHVTNAGNTRVWHCSGCGCEEGFSIKVLGPDGSEVALHDPHGVGPACPSGVAPLEPAESLEAVGNFTGVLYERDSPTLPSPTYPAPSGTYTVIAAFEYASSVPGEWIRLVSRTSFVWLP